MMGFSKPDIIDAKHLKETKMAINKTINWLNQVDGPQDIKGDKIRLFESFADLLTRDQWNHVLKEVARKSRSERHKIKREFSNLLNEQ